MKFLLKNKKYPIIYCVTSRRSDELTIDDILYVGLDEDLAMSIMRGHGTKELLTSTMVWCNGKLIDRFKHIPL